MRYYVGVVLIALCVVVFVPLSVFFYQEHVKYVLAYTPVRYPPGLYLSETLLILGYSLLGGVLYLIYEFFVDGWRRQNAISTFEDVDSPITLFKPYVVVKNGVSFSCTEITYLHCGKMKLFFWQNRHGLHLLRVEPEGKPRIVVREYTYVEKLHPWSPKTRTVVESEIRQIVLVEGMASSDRTHVYAPTAPAPASA